MRPLPFRARFIPRTKAIQKIFEDEAIEARKRLSKYDGDTKVLMENYFNSKVNYHT